MRALTLAPAAALLLAAWPALAQPAPSAAERSLAAALQQVSAAAQLYAEDMQRRIAAQDAEIARLRQACGDACAPPKPPKPPAEKAPPK